MMSPNKLKHITLLLTCEYWLVSLVMKLALCLMATCGTQTKNLRLGEMEEAIVRKSWQSISLVYFSFSPMSCFHVFEALSKKDVCNRPGFGPILLVLSSHLWSTHTSKMFSVIFYLTIPVLFHYRHILNVALIYFRYLSLVHFWISCSKLLFIFFLLRTLKYMNCQQL